VFEVKVAETKTITDQSTEERIKEYAELPKLGGDPQNTGESVTAMVQRVNDFSTAPGFISVLNIRAAE